MKVKDLFINWFKLSCFAVPILCLSSCDGDGDGVYVISFLFCLPLILTVIFVIVNLVKAKVKEKIEEKKMYATVEKDIQATQAAKAKLEDSNFDINTHPLIAGFKNKYNKDFIALCEKFRSEKVERITAFTDNNLLLEMYFSDNCFVIVKNSYFDFKVFFKTPLSLKEEILTRNVSLDDFEVFSYDEILYIEKFIRIKGEEKTFNKTSNLGLAITEEVWGVAAANRKANQSSITYKTPDIIYYKIVLNSSSMVEPILIEEKKIPKSLIDKKFDELLFIKTKEAYFTKKNNNTSSTSQTSSNLDDLKKLKELLDAGIITQEEFEAKKKQILGL